MGENKFVIAICAGVSSFPARQLNACYAGYMHHAPLGVFTRQFPAITHQASKTKYTLVKNNYMNFKVLLISYVRKSEPLYTCHNAH
jgi:hypothetical protein